MGNLLFRLPKAAMIMPVPKPEMSLTATINNATGLAASADGTKVYWLEDSIGAQKGRLMSLIWGGTPVVVADNLEHPKNLTLNSTYLYFSAEVGMAQVQVFRLVK
jgi:hypothetical protein